jgi:NodT family efflux transporter outer membrane factor (OMF) lipoprotein
MKIYPKYYFLKIGVVFFIALLAGCSLAPKYHRPDMSIPQTYKEDSGEKWVGTNTKEAAKDRGAWWVSYNDNILDQLQDKLTKSNQNLKAAYARYEEARAQARIARAGYFPTITTNAGANRQRLSTNVRNPSPASQYNDFSAGADISYEIDVWGRIRNMAAAGKSRTEASAADLASMDLSLHAELSMDYFALRGQDEAQAILNETVIAYERALKLTKDRHEGGAASEVDVDQAEAQLQNAKTIAADTSLKRSQLEHAIAVLIGETPSSFTLPPEKTDTVLIPVMPGLPSKLLEQRPDINAAALRVEAANADIGVARAAFFPDFSLSASGGVESAVLSKLLNAPSLFWSIGPGAALTVFDGGKINALSDQALAMYNESVANYRQISLTAFQEVEDNLAALRQLEKESDTQTAAVAASNRALTQAQNRYSGGIVTFLDVVIAQNIALQSQLNAVDIRIRIFTAHVLLIKALGGGYNQTAAVPSLPKP